MKKIFSTLLAASLMLLGTQAFAQMSVNAGYLNSTMKQGNSSTGANGAYAGVSFNIPVSGGFAIAPGVYYSMLASQKTEFWGAANGSFQEHAVNVPVYLNYGIDLARDTKVFIYGGPTLQYGLSSKVKHTAGSASIIEDFYKENGSLRYYLNPFNVYLGGGVGFQVSALQIAVGYDYGMMNLDKTGNTNLHRSNIKLGVGFVF